MLFLTVLGVGIFVISPIAAAVYFLGIVLVIAIGLMIKAKRVKRASEVRT